MKFGLMLPNKGRPYGDANVLLELALCAEQAGRGNKVMRLCLDY